MNINRRRGAIALAITLGVLIVGGLIAFNIAWIILNERRIALLVVSLILFGLITTGVVLNTVFLVREVRRNERQDSFLNAVTHELKTPIASLRLYLETLQRHTVPEPQRHEFYQIMLADSDRLLATVEQVLKAGELGARRPQDRILLELAPLVADCIAITLLRHHLPAEPSSSHPSPATSASTSAPSPKTSAPPSSTSSTTPSSTPPTASTSAAPSKSPATATSPSPSPTAA